MRWPTPSRGWSSSNRIFSATSISPRSSGATSRGGRRSTLAFLHRVFVKLTDQQRAERARQEEARLVAAEKTPLFDDEPVEAESEVDPEPLISAADVFDATQRDGPVGFAVVSATKKGNVWMARDFWAFQDVVYLARLFARMQRPVLTKAGRVFHECQPGSFFRALVDFEAKDESQDTPSRPRLRVHPPTPTGPAPDRTPRVPRQHPRRSREIEEGQTAPRFRQALRDRTPQGDPDGRRLSGHGQDVNVAR